MKVKIVNAQWVKEFEGKYGVLHDHQIVFELDGKTVTAQYASKSKEQKFFQPGQEAEAVIETRSNDRGSWTIIKPERKQGHSQYGKNLNREQGRYSGFAMSYAKDLVVADKVPLGEMSKYARAMFNLMVELDKTNQS